ncbi:hypothetical protein HK097_000769, partial [Rhizophlyctis rosea]
MMLRTPSSPTTSTYPIIALSILHPLLSYTAINKTTFNAPLIILLSEWLKLSASLIFRYREPASKTSHQPLLNHKIGDFAKYAVPAAINVLNLTLFFKALDYTSPVLLVLALLMKLPFTAILHNFFVRRQRSKAAWASLVLLFIGILISQTTDEYMSQYVWWKKGSVLVDPWKGFGYGVLIAFLSSVSSLYRDMVLAKDETASFWTSVVFTNLWETAFAIGALQWTRSVLGKQDAGIISVVIVLTALRGFWMSVNRSRECRASAAAVTVLCIAFVQIAFMSDLRMTTISSHSVLGCGLAVIGCWAHEHYRAESDTGFERLPDAESTRSRSPSPSSSRTDNKGRNCIPTCYKIFGLLVLVAVLAVIGEATIYKPPSGKTPQRLVEVGPGISSTFGSIIPNDLQHLEQQPYEERIAVDVHRYFTPNGIKPAVWGAHPPKNDGCIYEYMKKKKITANTEKALHWDQTLAHSGCPVYPSMAMLTHIYWSGPWRRFLLVGIDSWLATQPLSDGHKLIYWFTVDPGTEIRKRYHSWTDAGVLEFRLFNPVEEAKGTCLSQKKEWMDPVWQQQQGIKSVTMSDLIRTVILAKYGGIWQDTDNIVLRDLTPLIRTGPLVPQIIDDGLYYNDNILIHGPTSSGISDKVLGTACSISYDRNEWQYEQWVRPANWDWLYNDGLYRACRHATKCGVQGYPIGFMDGWCWGDHGNGVQGCNEEFGMDGPFPDLVGSWVWHGRLNQINETCFDFERFEEGREVKTAGAVVWKVIKG